jgi:hypothetical protein
MRNACVGTAAGKSHVSFVLHGTKRRSDHPLTWIVPAKRPRKEQVMTDESKPMVLCTTTCESVYDARTNLPATGQMHNHQARDNIAVTR